ncbi:MAG: Asp-tRNA(Asn)/Glu-tRNA(Gln) amidotransferase subunit GatA [Chloroflexi bacterium]|nr:Asp-tRNA(Asn)/Glu-tRNA(Gln) amidotransferase subunit GatA [Chloroflexota bacterium]MCI0578327.1 Asp-tRNA(Asn)/Glu-tRNA(Gln) amidotransferase subunit GatA [Chloroflexota bacterium]MCI0649005.1 Asp-tRNA(Asn)/Glu-tRNA(Gln) amidotransferase subunit GatA [Chloroflexota bacterium]MCI0729440.1 Asp-tRNA(Asn)/Glu-tRNA(Gln) amidotransferase subunit GatA [Chloroflexota bacterium]
MDLTALTLTELRDALRRGKTTSVAATQAMLDRIVAIDNDIKSYLTVTDELALEQADQADARRAQGEDTPLLGIPVAVKDIFCTQGVETTAGSQILQGFIPPYDAFAVQRLKEAGAVILGKTNTDEFAMGSSTENSGYFTTRNPWNLERVPGGSSGGSAAAVAAQMAYGALGTDTGGSVRQPASFCSVVGLRPTYGRVSRWGVVAFASSLDQVGPFGRTVADCTAMFQVAAGYDPRDSTSLDAPVPDYEAALTGDIRGLRVGVPREYFIEGIQPEVAMAVRAALDRLAELGAEIVTISLPHTRYALPVYYLIAPAEASANLARYDGVRYGPRLEGATLLETYRKTRALFGQEAKRRIMLGTYALSAGYYEAYYGRALKVRTLIKNDFLQAFEQVDVIAAPTSPTTAFKIGERADDPLSMYLADVFTLPVNLSASCGLSVPCGFDSQRLPIGLQLIGNTLQEATILNVAYAYEQATEWHKQLALS